MSEPKGLEPDETYHVRINGGELIELSPTSEDEVTDFNPERCPFTWVPKGLAEAVRCTRTVADHGASDHIWDSSAQMVWSSQMMEVMIEASVPVALTKPADAVSVNVATEVWDDDRMREAFIYDGGESEYHDPEHGAQVQRQVAGEIWDRWLKAHDEKIRAELREGETDGA